MGQETTGLETESLPYELQAKRPEATESAANMANDLLLQTESDSESAVALMGGVELDLTFGVPVEQQPIWIDLYENLRDVFFPLKLPPLELTSTPIPVPDRMAVKRNPLAVGISTTLNGLFLAFLLLAGVKAIVDQKKPPVVLTPIDLTDFKAPKAAVAAGGGGGSPDKVVVEKGKIPLRVQPIVTPKMEPPLPSIDVQKDIIIPDNPTLPNFGMTNSPNVKLGSLGNGTGTGIGSGNGSGYGPGSGGGIGGGLYRVGGAVSQPIPLNNVEAEFSDEARRAKYQGVCLISVIVDAQGNPQNPRVVRALGMGLDEKALEAVRKYKFKPAMKDGKTPVPVMINVEINFRLY
jgi:protein TonB